MTMMNTYLLEKALERIGAETGALHTYSVDPESWPHGMNLDYELIVVSKREAWDALLNEVGDHVIPMFPKRLEGFTGGDALAYYRLDTNMRGYFLATSPYFQVSNSTLKITGQVSKPWDA